MLTQRVAAVLAYEIHGTGFEAACLARGLNPGCATADDLLGPMMDGPGKLGGKVILPFDDDRMQQLLIDLEAPTTPYYEDPKTFVAEVTEIASLTKTESRVVRAIVDGSPIPDGKAYTAPLARRLNTTTAAVQKAWSRAKTKLRLNWATT
jgi:hypothetical protein